MSVSATLVGSIAAAAPAGSLLLLNNQFWSTVVLGSDLPLSSLRLRTNGVGQGAIGDTGSPLSYVNLSSSQWHTGNPITGSLYEVYFDSVTNPASGSASTWFGDTRDAWIDLGTQRTWIFQKNTIAFGTSEQIILVEIREIASPANTTGPVAQEFIADRNL